MSNSYPGYNPNKVYAYSLNALLKNDKLMIERFCDSIKKRGYAYVKLSPYLVSQIDECVNISENFFLKNREYKDKFLKKPIFGYFNAKHKESFRLLTGKRLNEHNTPDNFRKILALSKYSDEMLKRLCNLCSKNLFPNIKIDSKKYKIPLIRSGSDDGWGMLDITRYSNNGTKIGLNCNEHYDPGLLSIHFRSTQPGLQLKNEHDKWIVPPDDNSIAIIWAGDVATKINPDIKHGYHRVVGSNSYKPRLAIWYEVCTIEQEHVELMQEVHQKLADKEHESGIPISKTMSVLPKSVVSCSDPFDHRDFATNADLRYIHASINAYRKT